MKPADDLVARQTDGPQLPSLGGTDTQPVTFKAVLQEMRDEQTKEARLSKLKGIDAISSGPGPYESIQVPVGPLLEYEFELRSAWDVASDWQLHNDVDGDRCFWKDPVRCVSYLSQFGFQPTDLNKWYIEKS